MAFELVKTAFVCRFSSFADGRATRSLSRLTTVRVRVAGTPPQAGTIAARNRPKDPYPHSACTEDLEVELMEILKSINDKEHGLKLGGFVALDTDESGQLDAERLGLLEARVAWYYGLAGGRR